jgi:UDP-3-O-[3-hydroxymyristoyl] glucosamine N-acyltransferase
MGNVIQIINFIKNDIITIYGNPNGKEVRQINSAQDVDEYSLDWINTRKENKQQIAEQSKAKVIIADNDILYTENVKNQNKVLIIVKNPKLIVAKIANEFFISKHMNFISPYCFLSHNVTLGENVYIGANSSIDECIIEDNSYIKSNVIIESNVKIGKHVIIHSGTVIGTDGLGCERDSDGSLVKFPHFGGVVIEDYVEIGANCQIAKGVFGNTTIGKGTKINGLTFIAHNCILGQNVLITGQAMLAGSVIVENNVTIYSNVVIREHRKIGRNSIIGMGSVVTKDIPAGEIWIGNPAKFLRQNF